MKFFRLFFYSALLALAQFASAQSLDYGMSFSTYPHAAREFSGLALNDSNPIQNGGDTFRMDFSLLTRSESVFGSIFRIITDNGDNIDLAYSFKEPDNRCLNLITGDVVTEVLSDPVTDSWVDASIQLNPRDGTLDLKFGDSELHIQDSCVKGSRSYIVSFGICFVENYSNSDVASIDLRDVRIYKGEKLIRNWILGVHDGDVCYDEICGSAAKASNPTWIIDKYATWTQCLEVEMASEGSVAFDGKTSFYYSCTDGNLFTFDANTGKTVALEAAGVYPGNAPDQLIYTGATGLMAYSLDDNAYTFYSETNGRWVGASSFPTLLKEHDFWNKTTVWDSERGLLYSFGGYGHYQFNNNLIVVDPMDPATRKVLTLDMIEPRASATSCVVGDHLYVFAGRGNKAGKQEMHIHYNYDLYSIDLTSFAVRLLWSIKPEDSGVGNIIPGESMIYDDQEKCFYFVANVDGITLYKIGLDNPCIETISYPTGVHPSAQYTFRNLFLNDSGDKLYATQTDCSVDGASSLKIFCIDYPPVPLAKLSQVGVDSDDSLSWLWILAGVLAAALVAALAFVAVRRRSAGRALSGEVAEPVVNGVGSSSAGLDANQAVPYYDTSKSSICFFGGFKVMDARGEDITYLFTPTLKALTVLLIVFTYKNDSGIISNKLNNLIWSYKDEEAANNNRNVYMSKLRALLKRVGDISIVNQNKFWKIELGEGAYCDYLEAWRLYEAPQNEENISRLLEILLHGMMLPNFEMDWIDEFKASFSYSTINFLTKQFSRTDLDESFIVRAADTIFQHDYLNEDALKAKCRVLYKQGKTGLAKSCFDNFCSDYKKDIGMEYPMSFKEIVS